MADERLEELIVEFLERREETPSLTPEAFASEHPGSGDDLLAALRAALDIDGMFTGTPAVPDTIGAYRVQAEVGRGGMGIVYRVEKDGRTFALKLLPLAPLLGPRMLERFRREAENLAQLSHDSIVRIHETGMHGEMPYLVMDLVDGAPLHQIMESLSIEAAAAVVRSLCEAVHSAHSCGVLHRDLKPQNVLLRPDGTAVLVDFGLSAWEDVPGLTLTGELVGTPRYMAPEQADGGAPDARTDVHGLGLILYELITRKPARSEASREDLLKAVRYGRVPAPRRIDPAIPKPLEKIALKALARRPEHRYASAGEMGEDLARFLAGGEVRAVPPGLATRAWDGMAAEPVKAAGFAFAIVLAAVLLVQGLRPRDPGPEDLAAAAAELDRAATLWLDGHEEPAREAVRRSLDRNPGNPAAVALALHLSDGAGRFRRSAAADSVRLVLDAYAARDCPLALDRLGRLPPAGKDAPLLVAVSALCASESGEAANAEAAGVEAAGRLPGSATLQRNLARIFQRLGRGDEAERIFEQVTVMEPDSARSWRDLANARLRRRKMDEAETAILRALELKEDDTAALRTLANLRVQSNRGAEAREILRGLIAADTANAGLWYDLGYSHDLDHQLVEAEEAYRRTVQLRPDHGKALICLANLYSGASRGNCRGCDEAYAAHPEYLDMDRAEEYLLKNLDADGGGDPWSAQSALDIALRLEDRTRVRNTLERLTAGAEKTPAVVRMEELLARIRLMGR